MRPWEGVGEAYSASYAALCAGTTETIATLLGDAGSRTLLDVGSGTGLVAAGLARRGWRVTGCEPEPTMRAVAEREHPQIVFREGALPELPFADAAYGAVVANFVLNHVPDPRASARELARVSAGPAAATVWTSSPSWLWVEVCERAGLAPAAGERLSPENDFERTAAGFGAMLSEAGWRHVEVVEHTWTWQASPAALWASAEGGVASAGALYARLDEADRRRFRRAFDELCAQRAVGGLVPLEHTAAVAGGTRG